MSDLNARLQALLDREEIRDLVCRYAHLVWQNRPLDTVGLFAEDGVMDMGADGGRIEGRAALGAVYSRQVGEMILHPFVHNHVIELDGERASGFAYLDLRCVREGQSLIGSGHYLDRYVRERGRWRFSYRSLIMHYLVPPGSPWQQ